MAKCEYCGKDVSFGIKVSHSHRRSNRTWKPNIKRVKAIVNGSPKRVYACTRCLRSGKVTRAVWWPKNIRWLSHTAQTKEQKHLSHNSQLRMWIVAFVLPFVFALLSVFYPCSTFVRLRVKRTLSASECGSRFLLWSLAFFASRHNTFIYHLYIILNHNISCLSLWHNCKLWKKVLIFVSNGFRIWISTRGCRVPKQFLG